MKNNNTINNASLPTITNKLHKAMKMYNEAIVSRESAEQIELRMKAVKEALKAKQEDELKTYAVNFADECAKDSVNAWKEYLAYPWHSVSTLKKADNGKIDIAWKDTLLSLNSLVTADPATVKHTRFEKRAKVLWYLFVEYNFAESDSMNPIRGKYMGLYREVRESLKEWKAENNDYAKVSMASVLSTNLAEKMLNDIVADILPDGMTLTMKKADVRNIRDSLVSITIANNGKSKNVVHNFDSFLVQLIDAMYHRYNNVAYDVTDKMKK